jgi:hypothetical protein
MTDRETPGWLSQFVERRRSLRDEYNRILRVQMEASYLTEELRRRRDREQPQRIDLTYLREAMDEVDPVSLGCPARPTGATPAAGEPAA